MTKLSLYANAIVSNTSLLAGVTQSGSSGNVQLYDVSVRTKLRSNTNYYVSGNTGSDSNDGTSVANAWATIQHAYDYISQNIDVNGVQVNVYISNWSSVYDGVAFTSPVYNSCGAKSNNSVGAINFVGNNAQPNTVTIGTAKSIAGQGGANACSWFGYTLLDNISISIQGMRLSPNAGNCVDFDPIEVGIGSMSLAGNLELANCGPHQILLLGNIYDGASNILIDGTTLTTNCNSYYRGLNKSRGVLDNATVQINGAPNFIQGFIGGSDHSYIECFQTFTGNTGGVTGPRFLVVQDTVLISGGGRTYFPGNTPGNLFGGGQYINDGVSALWGWTTKNIGAYNIGENYNINSTFTNSSSIVMNDEDGVLQLVPGTALSNNVSVTLCSNPLDKQRIEIRTTHSINTFSFVGNVAGNTFVLFGQATAGNSAMSLVYNLSSNVWYMGT